MKGIRKLLQEKRNQKQTKQPQKHPSIDMSHKVGKPVFLTAKQ